MVVYYLKKTSERLADCRYPIKEGDICMLYDGDMVKTIYIDGETDSDSIWRDFKFIDTKSLRSYHFPEQDSILCAPVGNRHSIGNAALLTQLIQECKGEWLSDFLNETSAVLSGFVDYWDLDVLRRLTGDDGVMVAYEREEALSGFVEKPEEDDACDEADDDADNTAILPKRDDLKWFCLSVLACLEGQMDKRSYQILFDTLKGESRREIASRYHLTTERIRQIVVNTIHWAKELLIEQRTSLGKTKAENAKLKVQLDLLREEMLELKALIPKDVLTQQAMDDVDLSKELAKLLETPLRDISLPVRAAHILHFMEVKKFADIPQIGSPMEVLRVRNCGRKTVHDISRMLEDFHLSFGMSYGDVVENMRTYDWHEAKRKWIKETGNDEDGPEEEVSESAEAAEILETVKTVPTRETTIAQTEESIEANEKPTEGFDINQFAATVSDERRIREAILQAMAHFYTPVTPHDVARAINRGEWGDEFIPEDTIDSFLKRLPEVEYVKWGKYILKSRKKDA